MQYTTEGLNLEWAHPMQTVVDCLCGPRKGQYATAIENWFESYADLRGIKPIAFSAMANCAANSID